MDAKEKGAFRTRTPKFWQLILASAILLGLMIVGTSPNLGEEKELSPEELFEEAMTLKEEGKFVQAMKKLQLVVDKKPPVRDVFRSAEKELSQVRLKALKQQSEQKKKEQEQKAKQQAKQDVGKPADGTGESKPAKEPPGDNDKAEDADADVNLPELPDIGGGM
jgi:hypothetical protein